MNWVDFAIIAILGISMLISVIRGFVREAMSLVVWATALVVAMLFYQRAAPWLVDLINTPSLRLLAAWLALFVTVLIGGSLINYILGKAILASGLSGTDRFLGILFGAARGALVILAVLIMLPGILPVEEDIWWQQSVLIPELLRFEGWARELASTAANFFSRLF